MSQAVRASYIIPFRLRGGHRLGNLEAVIQWVSQLTGIEVIVVEQDSQPRVENRLKQYDINYVFQPQSGAFNKSLAMNHGVNNACSEVLVLADADMILAHQAMELCIEACRDHVDAVNPYTHLVDLSEAERNIFIKDGVLPSNQQLALSDRQEEGEQLCFCGGVYLMKRSVYQQIGGMDAAFIGWGGEDDAMSIKLQKLEVSQLIKHSETAHHLWHERSAQRYKDSSYAANTKLLKRYMVMSPQEMMEYSDRSWVANL